jgi:hypothetical protein
MKGTFNELFVSSLDTAEMFLGVNEKDEEIVCYIRETGCPEHEKAQRKYGKMLERSRNNRKRRHSIMAKIVAESLLIGWQGFLDDDGNPIPDDLDSRVMALTEFKKFFFDVLEFAGNRDNFRDDEIVEGDEEETGETAEGEEREGLSPREDTEKN